MSKQEIMFQHVENWKRSGLTQATYCEGQNLKTPTFSYWVIKYQKQNTHLDSESAFITIEAATFGAYKKAVQDYFQTRKD